MTSGPIHVPIGSILQHQSPLERPPWPDLRVEVDRSMIERAYSDLREGRAPDDLGSRPLTEHEYPDGRKHAERVAWLALNGWIDAISVDASLLESDKWAIEDGNHRLAAAALRGDEEIEVWIGGFEADIERHFGRPVADHIFGPPCAPTL